MKESKVGMGERKIEREERKVQMEMGIMINKCTLKH